MRNAHSTGMRRIMPLLLCLGAWVAPLPGATLRQLSLGDLIQKSSDIVRVKVMSSYGEFRGKAIYTHWKLQVTERWKGAGQASVDVLVPGGERYGVPPERSWCAQLVTGQEYLLFLWTSKSGATYLTGWGQGVFSLSKNGGRLDGITSTGVRDDARPHHLASGAGRRRTNALRGYHGADCRNSGGREPGNNRCAGDRRH